MRIRQDQINQMQAAAEEDFIRRLTQLIQKHRSEVAADYSDVERPK